MTIVKNKTVYDPGMARSGEDTREASLLRAALGEFAAVGFEGASLRSIARRAGMESGHLTYYVRTKDELWKRVIEAFTSEWADRVATIDARAAAAMGAREARALLRSLLLHFAEQPLLTRVMLHEFSLATPRNRWVLRRFARPAWQRLGPLFASLQRRRLVRGDDPWIAYFGLLGAAIIYYGSQPEMASIRGSAGKNVASLAMVDWLLDGLFVAPRR